jgi:hypothetical protein
MGEKTTLAPGVKVPLRMEEAVATGKELPYDIKITVTFEAGRFCCEELTCHRKPGGPPVTTERIREIPVALIVRRLAQENLIRVEETEPGIYHGTPFQWKGLRKAAEQGPTDETLKGVALLYRFAYACGLPPTKAVTDELKLPRSTASRWIALAREHGYLGTTRERKAGVN